MENCINISTLNDFIFCPRSIYFHGLYGGKSEYLYESEAEFKGTAAHSSIEEQRYSSKKSVIQNLAVYSEKYNLCGKIDIFFQDKGVLRERKKNITRIYDGYILQLYAQYYCLAEMGYTVNKLELYGMDTNKIFQIPKPEEDEAMRQKFENVINDMNSYNLNADFTPNIHKCEKCIYSDLCDMA
jgi:CRISPR-associated protein Cas4